MPKIALVTGGAGFIGSHVVDHLLKANVRVIVLDDLSGGSRSNVNAGARFIEGSIADESLLDDIFNGDRIDFVFHIAAYAAEGLSHFIRRFNYENNLIGSVNLINRAVKFDVRRFVFTSSIAVYGANQVPMTEDMPPSPEDPYGISKYAVELDLQAAHRMFGLDFTIFRPHNVYGERQNINDPYRNVIGIFLNRMLSHRPLPVFGDGKQTRAFSYIGDVAPHIANSVFQQETVNQTFNIGADTPFTILELADTLAGVCGTQPELEFLATRDEVKHAFSDHTKARTTFGITGSTDLRVGLGRMLDWAKRIGPSEPKVFENIEIDKNMPPAWKKLTRA